MVVVAMVVGAGLGWWVLGWLSGTWDDEDNVGGYGP